RALPVGRDPGRDLVRFVGPFIGVAGRLRVDADLELSMKVTDSDVFGREGVMIREHAIAELEIVQVASLAIPSCNEDGVSITGPVFVVVPVGYVWHKIRSPDGRSQVGPAGEWR